MVMSGVSFTSSASQNLGDEGYKTGQFPFSLDPEGVAALTRVSEAMARQYVSSVFSAYHAYLRGGSQPGSATSSDAGASVPAVVSPWAKKAVSTASGSSSGSRADEVRAMSTWRPVVEQAKAAVQAQVSLVDKDGYCYLSLVRADRRTSVAMTLGRWPLLEDVMALSLEDADPESAYKLQLVRKDDVVHIRPITSPVVGEVVSDVLTLVAAQFMGTGSRAIAKGTLGGSFLLEVKPFDSGEWNGRAFVGGESFEPGAVQVAPYSLDAEKQIIERAKKTLPELVADKRNSKLGFVWISELEEFRNDNFFQLNRSGVVEFGRDVSDVVHSIALAVPGRAIVQLPVGWKVSVGGATIGSEDTTVLFGFRDKCRLLLYPPLAGRGLAEAVVMLGKRVEWALEMLLNPKSTDARFVRALGLPAVLRFPKSIRPAPTLLEPSYVQITDPLQEWVAIDEVRYESNVVNDSCKFSGSGLIALKSFRASEPSVMVLGKFVTFDTSGAGIVLPSEINAAVHVPGVLNSNGYNWSVHKFECVDSYCMDGGGPSDSEFSDAI